MIYASDHHGCEKHISSILFHNRPSISAFHNHIRNVAEIEKDLLKTGLSSHTMWTPHGAIWLKPYLNMVLS